LAEWLRGGLLILVGVYLAVSIVAFAVFGFDKRAARLGRRRVSERTLLGLCVFGGWPGALLGRRVFRHKTVKQPFVFLMWVAVLVNVVVVGVVVWWLW
jgi:uncharacterized membrane protein YsdA (DUF1294 family)